MISFLLLFWTMFMQAGEQEISLHDSFLYISDEYEPNEEYPDFNPTLSNLAAQYIPPLNESQINLLKRKREIDENKTEDEKKTKIPPANPTTLLEKKRLLDKYCPEEPVSYETDDGKYLYINVAGGIVLVVSAYFLVKYGLGN